MSANSVLGLHVVGSQSAASIFVDGDIKAAVAEERLTRQKRSRAFPARSIDYCLETAGIADLSDVDEVVVAWNPGVTMSHLNLSGYTSWRRYDAEWLYIVPNNLISQSAGLNCSDSTLQFGGAKFPKVTYITHHHAHMGWAFASPFERAAIAVVDEYGEVDSFTFGTIRGNKVEVLKRVGFPHSLGVYYATLTSFLGFTANSDEWKVMGAAAFGDKTVFADRLRQIVTCEDGELILDQRYFTFANAKVGGYFTHALEAHLGLPPRAPGDELTQAHYDLAAGSQAVFEEVLISLLRWLHAETGEDALVVNGGCMMNSLANGRILEDTPFSRLYVSMAPADNGNCIGGPLWAIGTRDGRGNTYRPTIPSYLGPRFSDDEILELLRRYKLAFKRVDDIAAATADLLCDGKIVGWFQGRMEFGERALGCRSILADPRDAGMKDKVNATIKYREPFRPFAPSIISEATPDFFDLPAHADVRYMEQVYPFRPEAREIAPAVVHADGTGRLQMVHREDNPLYHRLIETFASRTGVPTILNTSFNLNGEPIVCSPDDAIRTFNTSGLDALVMGSYLLEK